MKFEVTRKSTFEVNERDLEIGDQIVVPLAGFGEFIATVQKVTDGETIFLFDECIAEKEINKSRTNHGGFEDSELHKWLQETVLPEFPDDIKKHMVHLSIPSYGMMFGHDEWYDDALESDDDEQFELMKVRKNRAFGYADDYVWYWLKNATKESASMTDFAVVSRSGTSGYAYASAMFGVLPVFVIKKKQHSQINHA